jgi:hypothetical protein
MASKSSEENLLFFYITEKETHIVKPFIFSHLNRNRGERVRSAKGNLSVIEAFHKKMEEVIAAEEDETQKEILLKALERGMEALRGRR